MKNKSKIQIIMIYICSTVLTFESPNYMKKENSLNQIQDLLFHGKPIPW